MNPAPILGVGDGHCARLLTKAREPLLLYRAEIHEDGRKGWFARVHGRGFRPWTRGDRTWVWYRIAASRKDLHGR